MFLHFSTPIGNVWKRRKIRSIPNNFVNITLHKTQVLIIIGMIVLLFSISCARFGMDSTIFWQLLLFTVPIPYLNGGLY